jgi:hypothetical protein
MISNAYVLELVPGGNEGVERLYGCEGEMFPNLVSAKGKAVPLTLNGAMPSEWVDMLKVKKIKSFKTCSSNFRYVFYAFINIPER